jgi:hypothetical protein
VLVFKCSGSYADYQIIGANAPISRIGGSQGI